MTETESESVAEKAFSLALAALNAEDTLTALPLLERALNLEDRAGWYSHLGYCIARERGQQRKGLEYCMHSLEAEPGNPDHYLNLGRVYLLGGEKEEALRVIRQGMATAGSPQLAGLLERLGSRKPPLFPSLSRGNPLNRYLGMLLARLGLR